VDPRTEALDALACTAVGLARRYVEAAKADPLTRATILRAAETVAHSYRALAEAMQLPGAGTVGADVLDLRPVRVAERAHELTGHQPIEAR